MNISCVCNEPDGVDWRGPADEVADEVEKAEEEETEADVDADGDEDNGEGKEPPTLRIFAISINLTFF